MEATKLHKTLFAMPLRWKPVVASVTLGLLLSVAITLNIPLSLIKSDNSTSFSSSYSALFSFFNDQSLIFQFRSSSATQFPVDGNYNHSSSTDITVEHAFDDISNGNMTCLTNSSKILDNPNINNTANSFTHRNSVAIKPPTTKHNNANPTSANSNAYAKLASTHTNNTAKPVPIIHRLNITGQHAKSQIFTKLNSTSTKTDAKQHVPASPTNSSVRSNNTKVFLTHLPTSTHSMKSNARHDMVVPSSSKSQKCDISIGKWVEDDSYPYYSPGSCPFVDESFSCQRNGRADVKYMRWRWAPANCNVPRFNGTDLLERFRGKRIVFVGDSLNRNQWESMLCMLRESLRDRRRVVQVKGGRMSSKSKILGAYVFKFLDYDCRVEFYASPYLVLHKPNVGSSESHYIIQLDKMDNAERLWRNANVLVFNTAHWWTPDKIGTGANSFQEGNHVHPNLDVMVAYKKALETWAKWVDRYVNPLTTSVFFRGYSPIHFKGGRWNSGGYCQNEKEPIDKESYLAPYPQHMQVVEAVLHKMRKCSLVKVLNITRLSDYRKDAHPAIFGHSHGRNWVSHQDCSHWCLPGLPDTWNELLYFALIAQ